MTKLDLIIAGLSGAALALLAIGAVQNVFNSGECIVGGITCATSLIYSILGEF